MVCASVTAIKDSVDIVSATPLAPIKPEAIVPPGRAVQRRYLTKDERKAANKEGRSTLGAPLAPLPARSTPLGPRREGRTVSDPFGTRPRPSSVTSGGASAASGPRNYSAETIPTDGWHVIGPGHKRVCSLRYRNDCMDPSHDPVAAPTASGAPLYDALEAEMLAAGHHPALVATAMALGCYL